MIMNIKYLFFHLKSSLEKINLKIIFYVDVKNIISFHSLFIFLKEIYLIMIIIMWFLGK